MTTSKKTKTILIVALVAVFITGLFFGFLLGKNVDLFSNAFSGKTLYQAKCPLYVNTGRGLEGSLSSADLVVDPQLFNDIALVLETCRTEIDWEYPGVEYALTLEKAENTTIIYIVATGEDPTQITEICNLAAALLPEKAAAAITGVSCKVIEFAKTPSAPIE